MATIKLGARPANFKRVVKFPMLDGSEGAIEVTYKYRTRTEFGAFIDAIIEEAQQVKPSKKRKSEDAEKFSLRDLMQKTADSNADYIMQVAEGWGLDEEFTRENVQRLADEFPAAAGEIMETYRLACTEGRLKN